MVLKNFFERIWVKNYLSCILSVWTVLIAISVTWNLYRNYEETTERARIEARTIFQHNLAYRRWNTIHGGVYAPISELNRPNPFLVDPRKNITTQSNLKMTLINPFQMTKQAYELLRKQSPLAAINRTVSLKPLNPVNGPDSWERIALNAFEEGQSEFSEITEINGLPYMRLLTPYITEKGCLKCHGYQGYKVGDVRGGMSIAVPMSPYYESAAPTQKIIVATHLLLWLLGSGTIMLFSKGLKRYQKEISENEKKFRIVSEFAYDFEFWIRENNEIVFISPSCERITGYSREEFREHPELLIEIIHPDDRETYRTHVKTFNEPSHEDMEYRIVTKSGQIRWLSHTCSPIYVDGEFLGRRGSNRDVTDRRKLEDQLFQAQKMESLGHFAGGVAHDFNNILTSVTGFTHLIKDELKESNKDISDYIKQIFIGAKLGKNLTSNLLAFGRKQIIYPKTVTLSKITNNISDILKTLLPEDIELNISLAEDELPILADPHQIEQVLINLCTNARDAMPEGGILKIQTNLLALDKKLSEQYPAAKPGTYMIIAMSDTGHGIDSKNMDSIFEPFFTTKEIGKGTGLGLAIVYSIISQHNGFIDVTSEVNKGTTFRIFLPATPEFEETESEVPPIVSDTAKDAEKTILVAEDDESVRRFLGIFLQKRGYSVILAEDGEDALRKYNDNVGSIDLAVLDVVLPKKNGKEVYDEMRAKNPRLNVLFMSGHTDDIMTTKGIYDEGLDFVPKPIDFSTFIVKVRELLHSKQNQSS